MPKPVQRDGGDTDLGSSRINHLILSKSLSAETISFRSYFLITAAWRVVGTDLNLVVDFCRFLCVCSLQGVDFDSKGGDCADLARYLRAETVLSESVRDFDNS